MKKQHKEQPGHCPLALPAPTSCCAPAAPWLSSPTHTTTAVAPPLAPLAHAASAAAPPLASPAHTTSTQHMSHVLITHGNSDCISCITHGCYIDNRYQMWHGVAPPSTCTNPCTLQHMATPACTHHQHATHITCADHTCMATQIAP